MRRIISFVLIAVACLTLGKASASSTGYEINTKYTLAVDGSAFVEATITSVAGPAGDFNFPVAGNDITEVSAKSEAGAQIEATLNQDQKVIQVKSAEPKVLLSYKTQLANDYGNTTIFDVPAQNYGDMTISKETVQMQSAVELGVGVPRGPKPEVTSISLGEQVLSWVNAQGAIGQAVGMIFGENAVANFNLDTTLKNNSWWWQTLEVVLPPDTNQQRVVLNSIEPAPSNLRLDLDGNIIAQYSLRPKGSVQVKASGEIHNSNYTYALSGGSGLDSIPQELKDDYTSTNETWNGDQIDSESKADQPVSQIIETTFHTVADQIPETDTGLESAQKWSNALVGELRSLGVPARLILGQSYTDGLTKFTEPQPFAWAEAYVPATGWVTLDPMVERGAEIYGNSDVERLALVLRGVDPGYPPGVLDAYSFNWQEAESVEPVAAVPTIKSVNHMILPGLAIRTVDVAMGSGTIVDDAALDVEGEGITKLGSLAPLEISTTNMLALGGTAFKNTKVSYGILGTDNLSSTVAETNTTVSYLPLIAIVLGIIFIIVAIVVLKRFLAKRSGTGKKSNMVLSGDDSGMSIDQFDFDDTDDPVDTQEKPANVAVVQAPEEPAPQEQIEPIAPNPAQNVTIRTENRPTPPRRKPPRLIQ